MSTKPLDKLPENIIEKIAGYYDITPRNITFIGGFENLIYEFTKAGTGYILRAGHSLRQPTHLVQAEIHWLNYLIEGGITAARPILSIHQNYVEVIPLDASNYLNIVVFEKFEGEKITTENPETLNPKIIENWGAIMGKMHYLTKNYSPPANYRRNEFETQERLKPEKILPAEDQIIIEIIQQHITTVLALPKTADIYGLIHGDLHADNFLVKDNQVLVFDFDDCEYKWFISDIAISLYWFIYGRPLKNKSQVARTFLNHFMTGYQRHNTLPKNHLDLLPDFIKLRDMYAYIMIHQMFTETEMPDRAKAILARIRDRVLGKMPYIQLLM